MATRILTLFFKKYSLRPGSYDSWSVLTLISVLVLTLILMGRYIEHMVKKKASTALVWSSLKTILILRD